MKKFIFGFVAILFAFVAVSGAFAQAPAVVDKLKTDISSTAKIDARKTTKDLYFAVNTDEYMSFALTKLNAKQFDSKQNGGVNVYFIVSPATKTLSVTDDGKDTYKIVDSSADKTLNPLFASYDVGPKDPALAGLKDVLTKSKFKQDAKTKAWTPPDAKTTLSVVIQLADDGKGTISKTVVNVAANADAAVAGK